jgi:hypothetical protein
MPWVHGIVVTAEGAGDMPPFRLPADPSPPLVAALFHLCQHVHQAGSLAVEPRMVALLLRSLWTTVAAPALTHLVATPWPDKVALQLMMDVRFLAAVVGPAYARAHVTEDGVSEDGEGAAAYESTLAGVLAALTQLVDPVDWAVFEPALRTLAADASVRTATLLGLLRPRPERGPADAYVVPPVWSWSVTRGG